MTLEELSTKLKNIVAQYETKWFLGDLSSKISTAGIDAFRHTTKLDSPFRQLTYLAGLNITSTSEGERIQMSQEEWDEIVELIEDIDSKYLDMILDLPDEIDEEVIADREITAPAFLSYYYEGYLNYEEQTIEKLETYFEKNEDSIVKATGLTIQDFVSIYNLIDELKDNKFSKTMEPDQGQREWREFIESQSIEDFASGRVQDNLPERYRRFFNFMSDKGTVSRFEETELGELYDPNKIRTFLGYFAIEKSPSNFIYYTSDNPVTESPIFKSDDGSFQLLSSEHLLNAIYLKFESIIKQEGGKAVDKYFRHRGKTFENKVVDLFKDFLGEDIRIFKGYYTDKGNEQDILILFERTMFIIEAKASRRVSPMRDPDKSLTQLRRNFEEVIQKGYDQSYRVKELYLRGEKFPIYQDEHRKNKVLVIDPRKYSHAFSIIPTLERYANLQTDLDLLLTFQDEKDSFPWSVCIDDLEIILLYLQAKYPRSAYKKLVDYLDKRELIHGGVDASDELDIFANYLKGVIQFDKLEDGVIFVPEKSHSHIYDDLYKTGFGFKNEKKMNVKIDPTIMKL